MKIHYSWHAPCGRLDWFYFSVFHITHPANQMRKRHRASIVLPIFLYCRLVAPLEASPPLIHAMLCDLARDACISEIKNHLIRVHFAPCFITYRLSSIVHDTNIRRVCPACLAGGQDAAAAFGGQDDVHDNDIPRHYRERGSCKPLSRHR